jgi:hypothetical protein
VRRKLSLYNNAPQEHTATLVSRYSTADLRSKAPHCTAPITEASLPRDFELPGFPDIALNEYSEWHQSRVFDTSLKADFQKARDVALEKALELDLIHEEDDPDFFEKQGVKRGTAKRFVRDMPRWAKRQKADVADVITVVP